MDDKIKKIIEYFEGFDRSKEFYVGDIITTITRIDKEFGKVISKCDLCNKDVDMNTTKHDWDYTDDMSSKVEWFVCPHCGSGDMDTNVTYEG